MLTALIAPVTNLVVSYSAGSVVGSVVKLAMPVGMKALPAFGINLGSAVVGGVVGLKVSGIVGKNLKKVMDAVKAQDESVKTDSDEE